MNIMKMKLIIKDIICEYYQLLMLFTVLTMFIYSFYLYVKRECYVWFAYVLCVNRLQLFCRVRYQYMQYVHAIIIVIIVMGYGTIWIWMCAPLFPVEYFYVVGLVSSIFSMS